MNWPSKTLIQRNQSFYAYATLVFHLHLCHPSTNIPSSIAIFIVPSSSLLHHPRPGKTEVVLPRAPHNDVVEDADTDVLQGLSDLVRGVDVLLAGIALSAGVVVHEHDTAGMVDCLLYTSPSPRD